MTKATPKSPATRKSPVTKAKKPRQKAPSKQATQATTPATASKPKRSDWHPTAMKKRTVAQQAQQARRAQQAKRAVKPDEKPRREPTVLMNEAYALILEAFEGMGYDIHDDNFEDTGPRAARAMFELVRPLREIDEAVDELIAKSFSARYDEMVISKHNVCFGMCPHHLLPVIYRVSLAYLPSKKVLGISKLTRVARLLARRPVLQEELTQDLAEVLHTRLQSRGAAVYIEGLHLCMAARGAESHEARVVTSSVRGLFRERQATRQEFLDLVTAPPTTLI